MVTLMRRIRKSAFTRKGDANLPTNCLLGKGCCISENGYRATVNNDNGAVLIWELVGEAG